MDERLMEIRINSTDNYDMEREIDIQREILEEEEREPFVITFLINSNDDIYGYIAKGSTGFSQYGLDIIAAAVSTLVINTIHSINQFTDDNPDVEMAKNDMKCIINKRISKDSKLLLKSLKLGMETIQQSYGEKYITINEIKLERSKRFFGLLS